MAGDVDQNGHDDDEPPARSFAVKDMLAEHAARMAAWPEARAEIMASRDDRERRAEALMLGEAEVEVPAPKRANKGGEVWRRAENASAMAHRGGRPPKPEPRLTPEPRRVKVGQTGFRGVSLRPSGRYLAQIIVDTEVGLTKSVGTFDTDLEAAHAWDRAAVRCGRPQSSLNFPGDYEAIRAEVFGPMEVAS